MTLQLKKSGSHTYLYAIKSFRKEDGRCTTKVVEKFGTAERLFESFFENLLHGQDVELPLPTDISGSEIGYNRAISHHKSPPKIILSISMPIVGK